MKSYESKGNGFVLLRLPGKLMTAVLNSIDSGSDFFTPEEAAEIARFIGQRRQEELDGMLKLAELELLLSRAQEKAATRGPRCR